ncbi:MAG: amidohydrolase family protein [bacterium]|nr:amidohydrolase family protein [bacterium]
MHLRFSLTLLIVIASLIFAWPTSAQEAGRTVVLHCGSLLAVPGSPAVQNMSVIIRRGRIVAIRPGFIERADVDAEPDEIDIVSLTDRFVLPGLIDSHTHITSEYTSDVRLRRLQESDADAALRGALYARRTLEAGFTTIRNVGSSGDSAFALRDAIRRGTVPGPRILVAGESLTPTGGHSDSTLGYRENLFPVPGAAQGVADGVAGARRAVRAQVKRGADLIKLTATGGVLSSIAAGTGQQFFEDELASIIATARLLGKRVAAHAHDADGINAALRAGVDSIEHGTFLNDESIRLFLKTGSYLVPTILAGKTVEARAKQPGFFPAVVARKALRVGPQSQEAFKRAHAAGVKIAFGTDSGVSPHSENAREFAYMIEAGMSEMDAIVSATVGAADLLGLSREIGTIEKGKVADLIATPRNPLVDVKELQRVVFVMHNGVVHRNDVPSPPSSP